MENKYQRNYWPHAIILSIIAIIFASAYTVVIALDNPVQMDDYYLQKYQQVDRNINKIIKKQKEFFAKYEVKQVEKSLNYQQNNTMSYVLIDKKSNKEVLDAKVFLHVTRPDSRELDQDLNASLENGKYIFRNIKVAKLGRWQFKLKVDIGKLEGFKEFEMQAYDEKMQKEFFEKYSFVCENKDLKYGDINTIAFSLKDKKSQKTISDAKVYLRILHQNGKKFTKTLQGNYVDGKYLFKTKKLHHTGKWSLESRILYGKYEVFVNQELNAIK